MEKVNMCDSWPDLLQQILYQYGMAVTAPVSRHTYMALVLDGLVLCKLLLCDVQAISAILYIRMYSYEETNRYLRFVTSDIMRDRIFNMVNTSQLLTIYPKNMFQHKSWHIKFRLNRMPVSHYM
jgi:hypothetical protein